MGFTLDQIETLFQNEDDIDSIEEALAKMELTPMGYKHKFVPQLGNAKGGLCRICGHIEELHYDF